MEKKAVKYVYMITNFSYILVSMILFAISFVIIFWSVWQIIHEVFNISSPEKGWHLYKIMDEVALIVFAVAVADVAKYLLIEEVFYGKENKPISERRKAHTNLMLIISTAFCLEGLILTIQIAQTNIEKLLYPIMLLIVSSVLLISLGIYQKLSIYNSKN